MAKHPNGTLVCGITGRATYLQTRTSKFILVLLPAAVLLGVAMYLWPRLLRLSTTLAIRSQASVVSCIGVLLCKIAIMMKRYLFVISLVDASQARANGRMDSGIKGIMGNTCNGGFEYPPCDAPTWDHSGRLYTAGNRVSHK